MGVRSLFLSFSLSFQLCLLGREGRRECIHTGQAITIFTFNLSIYIQRSPLPPTLFFYLRHTTSAHLYIFCVPPSRTARGSLYNTLSSLLPVVPRYYDLTFNFARSGANLSSRFPVICFIPVYYAEGFITMFYLLPTAVCHVPVRERAID